MAERILRAVELIKQHKANLAGKNRTSQELPDGPVAEVSGWQEGRIRKQFIIRAVMRNHPIVDMVAYMPHKKLGHAFTIFPHTEEILPNDISIEWRSIISFQENFWHALQSQGYTMQAQNGDKLIKHKKKLVAVVQFDREKPEKVDFIHIKENHVEPLVRLMLGEHKALPAGAKRLTERTR